MTKRIQPNEIKMAKKLYESGIRGINEELRRNLGVTRNRAQTIMAKAKKQIDVGNSAINDVDGEKYLQLYEDYVNSVTDRSAKRIVEIMEKAERNYQMAYWNRVGLYVVFGILGGMLLVEIVF